MNPAPSKYLKVLRIRRHAGIDKNKIIINKKEGAG